MACERADGRSRLALEIRHEERSDSCLNRSNRTVPYQQFFAAVRDFILSVSTKRKTDSPRGTCFF
jgi:hypothetical protein